MADVVFVHPDDLAAIDMLAGPAPTDIPRIEHGPQFVYESAEQQRARTWLNIGKRHGASWRKPSIRGLLCCLLDPTYVHPKRIKR